MYRDQISRSEDTPHSDHLHVCPCLNNASHSELQVLTAFCNERWNFLGSLCCTTCAGNTLYARALGDSRRLWDWKSCFFEFWECISYVCAAICSTLAKRTNKRIIYTANPWYWIMLYRLLQGFVSNTAIIAERGKGAMHNLRKIAVAEHAWKGSQERSHGTGILPYRSQNPIR